MDTGDKEYALQAYLGKLKDTINSELQILFVKAGWVVFEIQLITNLDHLKNDRVVYEIEIKGYAKDQLIADADEAKGHKEA